MVTLVTCGISDYFGKSRQTHTLIFTLMVDKNSFIKKKEKEKIPNSRLLYLLAYAAGKNTEISQPPTFVP